MKYTLPDLLYDYSALEPHIDSQTMEIHHTKHHQAYTDKMNAVLEKYPDLADKPLEEIMQNLNESEMNAADKKAFRNNGGGYLNHSLFWEVMGPEKAVDDALVSEIEETFGSVDEFKTIFEENAKAQFGSGWSWLVRTPDGKLNAYSTPNQDSPYLTGDTPIFGLDVWEHAYYLKYQNKRPDYVSNWWNVLKILP
ncbi:MAG: superoxide dismutase [Patescibacteria group bacterium]